MMKTVPNKINQQTPIRKQGKDPLIHLKGGSGATIIKRADLIISLDCVGNCEEEILIKPIKSD
jgi:hypothetical protein